MAPHLLFEFSFFSPMWFQSLIYPISLEHIIENKLSNIL